MPDINNLSEYQEQKNRIVTELIECLRLNYDWSLSHKALFFLVDNFKDEKIIPALFEIALKDGINNVNGTIIFACQEYSPVECKPYFQTLTEIVINSNYEASWSASTLITNFPKPYDLWEPEIVKVVIVKLKDVSQDATHPNQEFIANTITFIESLIYPAMGQSLSV